MCVVRNRRHRNMFVFVFLIRVFQIEEIVAEELPPEERRREHSHGGHEHEHDSRWRVPYVLGPPRAHVGKGTGP